MAGKKSNSARGVLSYLADLGVTDVVETLPDVGPLHGRSLDPFRIEGLPDGFPRDEVEFYRAVDSASSHRAEMAGYKEMKDSNVRMAECPGGTIMVRLKTVGDEYRRRKQVARHIERTASGQKQARKIPLSAGPDQPGAAAELTTTSRNSPARKTALAGV